MTPAPTYRSSTRTFSCLRAFRISLLALPLAGCASYQERAAYSEISSSIHSRVGGRTVWNRGDAPDRLVANAIREMLSHDLTVESAVQIALLNNRNVQATYAELGIAQADVAQAGLLSNPVLQAFIGIPEAAAGKPELSLQITGNFLELISLPLKKKIAAATFDAAKARLAMDVVNLATDVKTAYYTLLAAEETRALRQKILLAETGAAETSKQMQAAGNTTSIAAATRQAAYARAKLADMSADADAMAAREKLVALLGLWGPTIRLKLADRLEDMPASEPSLEDIERVAVAQRLDLVAARAAMTAAMKGKDVPPQWIDQINGNVSVYRGLDDPWAVGPGIQVPLPIFDTGVVSKSGNAFRARQAYEKMYALSVQIRSDARAARDGLTAARARAEYVRDTILPLQKTVVEQTLMQYNAGAANVFDVLSTKRDEIDAQREYVEAVRDYWLARVTAERAAGGNLPGPTTRPTSMPAMPTTMGS